MPQQLVAGGERAEELVVEVVAVGQDHEGGVGHGRVGDDLAGVEGHGQALARSLGVPDHADPLVALGRGGADRAGDGLVDRVVLVIAGQLLPDGRPVHLEDDEVADEVQEPLPVEDPLEQDFELGRVRRGDVDAVDRPPGHEPLPVRCDRPDPGVQAVGDDHHLVEGEQAGDVFLVGLELVEGRLDRGVLVAWVLQLQHGQGDAVDEHDQVGAAVVLVLDDRELVDHQPVVSVRVCEVEQPDLVSSDRAVRTPVLDIHAIGEQPVEPAVVFDQARRLGP